MLAKTLKRGVIFIQKTLKNWDILLTKTLKLGGRQEQMKLRSSLVSAVYYDKYRTPRWRPLQKMFLEFKTIL